MRFEWKVEETYIVYLARKEASKISAVFFAGLQHGGLNTKVLISCQSINLFLNFIKALFIIP